MALLMGCVEGIRRALVLDLVLMAGTTIKQAPSVGQIGLDFLFITFLLHFFLSWTSSLSISSSAISTSTLSNHVRLGITTGLLHLTLNSILFSPSPHHMSIPSQSTISNDSCDRLNFNQSSQFFICPSVFHGDTTHPSNHLHLYSFKL